MTKPFRADKRDYQIVHTFRLLYDGWEMDNEAWVAKNKRGELTLLVTNHGGLWDMGRDVSQLHKHITEARDSIAGIKKAISMLATPGKSPGRDGN